MNRVAKVVEYSIEYSFFRGATWAKDSVGRATGEMSCGEVRTWSHQ